METLSPDTQLEEDQARLDKVLAKRRTTRNPFTMLSCAIRAEYLGVVVQQDLEEVELADHYAIAQRTTSQGQ